MKRLLPLTLALLLGSCRLPTTAPAAELIVTLTTERPVALVGVLARWDQDGNALRPVDPKARIDAPDLTATARQTAPGVWSVADLKPGRYDLVIVTRDKLRIEGFDFPPVLEFEPFLAVDPPPPARIVETLTRDIAAARQYENKVEPLFFAGDATQVRVFLQLLRDQPTSYDAEAGQSMATLRHELWQFTERYGGWEKQRRTRVFDRLLLPRQELAAWTWLWDPRLGGIQIDDQPVRIEYSIPKTPDRTTGRGLFAR